MIGFYDLETGGFSITKNAICEIAMIAVNPETLEITNEFHKLIKPYTRADDTDELVSYKPDAMAVNGLSEQQLIDEGFDVTEVCVMLNDFIIENDIKILIGHCSRTFDNPRLKYLLERFLNINIFKEILIDDTHDIAKDLISLPNYKLKTICDHYGITNSKEHSALGDTYATFEVWKKLTQI